MKPDEVGPGRGNGMWLGKDGTKLVGKGTAKAKGQKWARASLEGLIGHVRS